MRDHRIDRGASALGILFVLFGLIGLVWVVNGANPEAIVAVAPYLVPIAFIGLGLVVMVMAVTSDGERPSRVTPGGPPNEARASTTDRPSAPQPVVLAVGDADHADIEIVFGAGHLRIGRAEPGHLVDGIMTGGGIEQDRAGRVHLWSETPWLEWVPGLQRDWTIGVTGEVPVRMEVKAGAADVDLDCHDLRLEELVVRSGASSVHVQAAARGHSRIRTENGAGSLDVTVPEGVAARVRTTALLGSREIDLGRFPAVTGGYESPGFSQAADRVEIDAQTAIGSLRVR
jgi:hypothetical protein